MSENVKVRLSVDGENFNFEMKKSESLLDTALENDIDLPYSCQSGVCTACRVNWFQELWKWRCQMGCQMRKLMRGTFCVVNHFRRLITLM